MTAEQIRYARDLLTRPDNTVSFVGIRSRRRFRVELGGGPYVRAHPPGLQRAGFRFGEPAGLGAKSSA